MSKLIAGNYVEFTLSGSDKVRTSGVIVTTTPEQISYCDEDTKLLCWVPPEDVAKVHKSVPATKEQLAWRVAKPINVATAAPRGVPVPAKAKKVVVPVQAVAKAPGAGAPTDKKITKLDRAYELMLINPTHTKDQLVDLFVDVLQMSPAGALTYYYNVSKRMRT